MSGSEEGVSVGDGVAGGGVVVGAGSGVADPSCRAPMGVMAGMLGMAGDVGDPRRGPAAQEAAMRTRMSCATAHANRDLGWKAPLVPIIARHSSPTALDVKRRKRG